MSIILNIRGANGSGKTTVVRKLMSHVGVEERLTANGKIWGYQLQHGLFVLGSYERECGGAEGLTFAEIKASVLALATHGDVVFEGVLWSTVFKSSDQLAREVPNGIIFALMDTPVDVCIERVVARRLAAGNNRPFDPTNVLRKHKEIARTHRRLREAGHEALMVPHQDAPRAALGWLNREHDMI